MAKTRSWRILVLAFALCTTGALGWTYGGQLGSIAALGSRHAVPADGDWLLDPDADADSAPPVVVAELFTSEGCSSCPPADEVLRWLAHRSAKDVFVIALGEHVRYWDHLGWKDPYSSAALTARQALYQSRVFPRTTIYTPQLVIDGQFEAVGSDVPAIRRAVSQAITSPKGTIAVSTADADRLHLEVTLRLALPADVPFRQPAELVMAVAQDGLTDEVTRGENRGRRLRHSSVVRSMEVVESVAPRTRTFETTAIVPIEATWNRRDLTLVALLQERESRRIIAAGVAPAAPAN